MTFKQFEQIVRERRPDVEVFQHGNFTNKTTLSVAVIFNGGKSKTYLYHGSYVDVLNRLGIKAVTKAGVQTLQNALQRCKELNGTKAFFGRVQDFTEEIAYYEEELADIRENCIIV